MKRTYTKKEALCIITNAAKEYAKRLEGVNYLFIYRNRENNRIEFFESIFLPRNYQHLTGIELLDSEGNIKKSAAFFYKKCLANAFKEEEIQFRQDGTTPLKLEALPKLVQFLRFSKMTVMYNGIKPKLAVDRLVGTTNYCLGFTQDEDYYVPSSCLLEDIRNLGNKPSQILAIMSKQAKTEANIYSKFNYLAKGVPFNKMTLPPELSILVSLDNYPEK